MVKLKITNALNEDDLQWNMTSKYQKYQLETTPHVRQLKLLKDNISATTDSTLLNLSIDETSS